MAGTAAKCPAERNTHRADSGFGTDPSAIPTRWSPECRRSPSSPANPPPELQEFRNHDTLELDVSQPSHSCSPRTRRNSRPTPRTRDCAPPMPAPSKEPSPSEPPPKDLPASHTASTPCLRDARVEIAKQRQTPPQPRRPRPTPHSANRHPPPTAPTPEEISVVPWHSPQPRRPSPGLAALQTTGSPPPRPAPSPSRPYPTQPAHPKST